MEGFRAQAEQAAAHGGQVDGQRVVPAVDAAVGGVECFGAGLVRAAPDGGLGVQQFFGPTGKLEAAGGKQLSAIRAGRRTQL